MNYWDGGTHMGWMAISWIIGLVLVAAVVWPLIRSTRDSRSGANESPEDIVRRRYASGAIDRETHDRMMTDLKR
jgi:putative membrane protein